MSPAPQDAQVVDLTRHRQTRDGVEPWATKQQLAAHLGFSVRWVENRMRDGLPYQRIGGRARFRYSAVEQWLADRERDAAA